MLSVKTRTQVGIRYMPNCRWHWRFLLPLYWYEWNIGDAGYMSDVFRVRFFWFIELEHWVSADADALLQALETKG
jgi:hypothetical protein